MRRLLFEPVFDVPLQSLWEKFADVNSYSKYIKNCHKSVLVGPFKAGSIWYDWSTVIYLPLKINHQIIKVIPKEEIIYKINLPFGEIWQKVDFVPQGVKTKVRLEIEMNFRPKLIDKTLGSLIYLRNQQMLSETIKNYYQSFNENN